MLRIGAHVDQDDPLGEGRARAADLVQFFLGDPQSWRKAAIPTSRCDRRHLGADDSFGPA